MARYVSLSHAALPRFSPPCLFHQSEFRVSHLAVSWLITAATLITLTELRPLSPSSRLPLLSSPSSCCIADASLCVHKPPTAHLPCCMLCLVEISIKSDVLRKVAISKPTWCCWYDVLNHTYVNKRGIFEERISLLCDIGW
jgi:hypothetical protein